MKRAIFLLLLAAFGKQAYGQRLINGQLYSPALKDTIRYRVWLPADYDPARLYPFIYTVEDTEDQAVAGAVNYYARQSLIPGSVVVGIIHGRQLIDFDFNLGQPNPRGQLFLGDLMTRLMPDVERRYHASRFRALMGHSYSATYGNYLLLQHPGLFTGYMLFAPEAWWVDEQKPVFELSAADRDYYQQHPAIVYLASGTLDIERRRKYFARITRELQTLDTSRFSFRSRAVEGSDHLSVVLNGIADGLAHLFKPYYQFNMTDSVASPLAFFEETKRQLAEIYGIGLEKNNRNIAAFTGLASTSHDPKAMDAIIRYFADEHSSGLDLFNMAYGYLNVGEAGKARDLFLRCIEKTEKDELTTVQGQLNLVMAYRAIAFSCDKNDNAAAWAALEKAIADPEFKNSLLMHFYLGKLSADRQYRVADGLKALLHYEKTDVKAGVERWNIQPEAVYLNIGKCYVLLDQKAAAKTYLEKALAANPKNKEAQQWLLQCN